MIIWDEAKNQKLISERNISFEQITEIILNKTYINIRINESDLLLVKERSVQYGIPYQTLIASIIHRYVTDQLVDERAVSIAAKRS